MVGTGLMTGAALSLPSAIHRDLIEWDAHQSGQLRPGDIVALWGNASKLVYALAVGIVFPLLDIIGFDATASNAAEDVRTLAILYGGPSNLFKIAAIALMHNFPIKEAEHRRIREALAASG